MNKVILSVLLSFAITNVIAQTCSDTDSPLLATYVFTPVGSPTVLSGLEYCKSLETDISCCAAETVNGFRGDIDEVIQRLETLAANRDRYFIDERKKLYANRVEIARFISAATSAWTANRQDYLNDAFAADQDYLYDLLEVAREIYNVNGDFAFEPDFIAEFPAMQKARSTCIANLLSLQVSAWCNACNPTIADDLTPSSELNTRLSTSCSDYIGLSKSQYDMFWFKWLEPELTNLANFYERAANKNFEGGADLFTAVDPLINDIRPDETDSSHENLLSASAIFPTFFPDSQLQELYTIVGGMPYRGRVSLAITRLLQENRNLQSGWNPEVDEPKMTITFSENPGQVVNELSAFRQSVIVCMFIVLLSLIF